MASANCNSATAEHLAAHGLIKGRTPPNGRGNAAALLGLRRQESRGEPRIVGCGEERPAVSRRLQRAPGGPASSRSIALAVFASTATTVYLEEMSRQMSRDVQMHRLLCRRSRDAGAGIFGLAARDCLPSPRSRTNTTRRAGVLAISDGDRTRPRAENNNIQRSRGLNYYFRGDTRSPRALSLSTKDDAARIIGP
jgi:hypothetical protein